MITLSKSSYPVRKYCPLHKDPCDNCYCITLSSQDIEKAIYYCTGNFKACPIYQTDNCRRKSAVHCSAA